MFKVLLIVLTALFFVNPAQASNISDPYFITDVQANAPGFSPVPTNYDGSTWMLTVEQTNRNVMLSAIASSVYQVTQPSKEVCIDAMKRAVKVQLDPLGGSNMAVTRRAYCTPALMPSHNY